MRKTAFALARKFSSLRCSLAARRSLIRAFSDLCHTLQDYDFVLHIFRTHFEKLHKTRQFVVSGS